MLIPANAVGKVLGKGGANIANIRKVGSHILNFIIFYVIAGVINFFFKFILKLIWGLVLAAISLSLYFPVVMN